MDSTPETSADHDQDTGPRAKRERTTAGLLRRWRKGRGREREDLIQQVIAVNMPVAEALARRYAGRGIADDDLQQVAMAGLVAAARRFDPRQGEDFLAYAVPTIKGELRRAFRDTGWMIRPPRRLQEVQASVWAAEDELSRDLERPATTRELAEHLDLDPGEVTEAQRVNGCFSPRSLDRPLGDGEDTTLGELQGEEDPDFASSEARAMLGPVVRQLPRRDRKIIELRYFRGWTQKQIGRELGVTQTQVSRLLTRILRDLRADIEAPAA